MRFYDSGGGDLVAYFLTTPSLVARKTADLCPERSSSSSEDLAVKKRAHLDMPDPNIFYMKSLLPTLPI